MTSGSVVPTLVHKELRALAPVFLLTTALVPLFAVGFEPELMTIGLGVYVLGACALGALSIGHEFTHDTLGQLLSQPGHRRRLLTVKLLVLAALLTILAAAATITLWPWADSYAHGGRRDIAEALRWPVVVIPVLLALGVAPVLTMIAKGAMAGTVFTVAVYAGLWLLVPGITAPSFPWEGVDVQFYASVMVWIAAILSMVSAATGVVAFGRLESTGSHAAATWESQRPANAVSKTARIAARPRHPVSALLGKELRLQTVTFVVSGLFVAAWMLFTATGSHSPEAVYAFEGGTLLYQFTLATLIGALASAEERGLGTLHWQTLQPYAAWKQWTIKAVTALTLTSLLVIALPVILQAIDTDAVERLALGLRFNVTFLYVPIRHAWIFGTVLLALTATGLFTSSFNRSSLHALLAAGLLAAVSGIAMRSAFVAGRRAVWKGLDLSAFYSGYATSEHSREALRATTWTEADFLWTDRITILVAIAAVAGFLFHLLSTGLKNHQSAETPRTVVARQVVSLLACGLIASLVVGGGHVALQYFLLTH